MNQSLSQTVRLGNRDLEVRMTPRAARQLASRTAPLHIEMELYFSCLIRKRVNFPQVPREALNRARLSAMTDISFRPVMTRHCSVRDVQGEPPVEDFPVTAAGRFTPHWLELDYRRGNWQGRFGFGTSSA